MPVDQRFTLLGSYGPTSQCAQILFGVWGLMASQTPSFFLEVSGCRLVKVASYSHEKSRNVKTITCGSELYARLSRFSSVLRVDCVLVNRWNFKKNLILTFLKLVSPVYLWCLLPSVPLVLTADIKTRAIQKICPRAERVLIVFDISMCRWAGRTGKRLNFSFFASSPCPYPHPGLARVQNTDRFIQLPAAIAGQQQMRPLLCSE